MVMIYREQVTDDDGDGDEENHLALALPVSPF
jgi:hypothetical protein